MIVLQMAPSECGTSVCAAPSRLVGLGPVGWIQVVYVFDLDVNLRAQIARGSAQAIEADIVLLTGDVFEHNRLNATILERTRAVLGEARLPIVMLPGNHDPLICDSVWDRGQLSSIDNIHVLA